MRHLHLIYITTLANLKSRYRNTWSGFLWVMVLPIMSYLAQSYAFSFIIKINVENYFLYLMSGLLPWVFIQQSVETASSQMLQNGNLLKSFPISPLHLIGAQLLDNFINFLCSFMIILAILSFWHPLKIVQILIWPLCALCMILGVFSLVWIVNIVNVFFRDTRFIVSFIFSIGYYFTPIFYPLSLVPAEQRWLIELNPIYPWIKPFQTLTTQLNFEDFAIDLTHSLMSSLLFFFLATFIWRRYRNECYFRL